MKKDERAQLKEMFDLMGELFDHEFFWGCVEDKLKEECREFASEEHRENCWVVVYSGFLQRLNRISQLRYNLKDIIDKL